MGVETNGADAVYDVVTGEYESEEGDGVDDVAGVWRKESNEKSRCLGVGSEDGCGEMSMWMRGDG